MRTVMRELSTSEMAVKALSEFLEILESCPCALQLSILSNIEEYISTRRLELDAQDDGSVK